MVDDANPTTAEALTTPQLEKHVDDGDTELKAIDAVVKALSTLTEEQRLRALDYVLGRFSVAGLKARSPASHPGPIIPQPTLPTAQLGPAQTSTTPVIQDIRTLKEIKIPKSASEMAALVAYYVSELAPGVDRKADITKPDIERYFKAAGFNLPADASFTLVNAKNAGYLESAGPGKYKLNPVGYNLVVHRMGARHDERKEGGRGQKAAAKRRPKPAKKASRAKK